MNDDTLLSRLAPVTDEQASAMVSGRALGEMAEDIVRAAQLETPAALARHQAPPVSRTRRRLTWAAASALAAAAAVAVAVAVTAGQPAPGGRIAQSATSGGEADAGIDVEVAQDLLVAPLIFRLMTGHRPLVPEEADKIAAAALGGLLRHPPCLAANEKMGSACLPTATSSPRPSLPG